MEKVHVPGTDRGKIFLYTLSTCGWCRKTKAWLNDAGLEYTYVDVDLLPPEEKTRALEELKRWNPRCSYPTVVVNGSECLVGFDPDRLQEMVSK
ncbi:MAG: glutaredoxin family protein [bacterium]|nr:MAG: glutaredoxin family protein [bacterium]